MELMAYELFVIIPLAVIGAWVVALVDILRSNFEGNEKLLWVLLIIFLPFLGTILYFIIGRNKKVKDN